MSHTGAPGKWYCEYLRSEDEWGGGGIETPPPTKFVNSIKVNFLQHSFGIIVVPKIATQICMRAIIRDF